MTAKELRRLSREHERLMSEPPYPHDGWAMCSCEIAKRLRKHYGFQEPRR